METQTLARPKHRTTSKEKVVEIKHLYKSFDSNKVLDDFSLELFQKENLVILGKSGSGKSVLIKCMVGLLKADSGEIKIMGYDVPSLDPEKLNELRRKVGFSFQGSALYDSMTVRENLEFPIKRNLKIYDRGKLNKMVMDALNDVGLERAANKRPAELSGGMKKRVGIARTLILNPVIMLYDEPTAGLDPVTSEEINQLILTVRDKYNTSSIIITHDITCAHHTSDRIILLHEGRNKVEGTFDELKGMNSPELQAFFNY